jgi:hypothetical protein
MNITPTPSIKLPIKTQNSPKEFDISRIVCFLIAEKIVWALF